MTSRTPFRQLVVDAGLVVDVKLIAFNHLPDSLFLQSDLINVDVSGGTSSCTLDVVQSEPGVFWTQSRSLIRLDPEDEVISRGVRSLVEVKSASNDLLGWVEIVLDQRAVLAVRVQTLVTILDLWNVKIIFELEVGKSRVSDSHHEPVALFEP